MHADVNGLSWRKSSYSNGEGGSCVEVSDDLRGVVPVRDSKLMRPQPGAGVPGGRVGSVHPGCEGSSLISYRNC